MLAYDNYDLVPMDVAERIEAYKDQNNENYKDEEWVIFRSRFEDRLWIVKKIFEETHYQVIACPLAYQSHYITSRDGK